MSKMVERGGNKTSKKKNVKSLKQIITAERETEKLSPNSDRVYCMLY